MKKIKIYIYAVEITIHVLIIVSVDYITDPCASVVSKIYAFLSSRVIIRSVGWETRRTALISRLANQIVSKPRKETNHT